MEEILKAWIDNGYSFLQKHTIKFWNLNNIDFWEVYEDEEMWKQVEDGYFESTNHLDRSKSGMKINLGKIKSLSFDWNVDSEEYYDSFNVYINGNWMFGESGTRAGTYNKEYSGEKDIILAIEYTKDGSVSEGEDVAWIKNIKVYW